jgi:predicted NUDIX family NTP pyrophosphohydrolase
VHPGGPFWARKDEGAWSIPKGEIADQEEPLEAAEREFREETGCLPDGESRPLPRAVQPSGKVILAWARQGDLDASAIESNTFTLEWPPHSGRQQEFPEVDRAAWLSLDQAIHKIVKGQVPLLQELARQLGRPVPPVASPSGQESSEP